MYKKSFSLSILLYLLSLTVYSATPPTSDIIDAAIVFDDKQLEEAVAYPDWFKFSLGDLNDDLAEAKKAGKKGIITYFGQKRCAYCEQFFKSSLSDVDIKNYLQKHFDLIAFDIWGIDDITDTDGTTYTERDLSIHYKTNFTPSLVFYNKAPLYFVYVVFIHLINFVQHYNTLLKNSIKKKLFLIILSEPTRENISF